MKEEIAKLQENNIDLSLAISDLESELASNIATTHTVGNVDFSIQTKSGRRYSPAIRKLYYTLLADQVPTSKIADIIKTIAVELIGG